MRKNLTPTIESGLLAAMTVILGLVTVYVPLLGMLTEFFCAVPLAVLTARHGAGKGLSALVVATLVLSMLISPILSLRLAMSSGVCGVILGWCVWKKFGATRIFFTTLIAASMAQVVTLALLLAVLDLNFIETQIEILREAFDESFNMYESMGVDPARIAETKAQVDPALQSLMVLIPTLLMLSALMSTVATWLTSRWIFPKLRLTLPKLPSFAEWKFPAIFLYMAAFGGIGIYWGFTRGWNVIYEISLNLTIVAMIIGLIQGLSLMSFLFDRYKVSKFVRRFLYVLLILNMFLLQLVAITGLIDMLFDYRKRFFKD